MELVIDFPGGSKVDAHFEDYTVRTDQPVQGGGEGSAPTPFAIFLSSIGTCAGIYVLGFCRKRGLPTAGIRILQHVRRDPATGMVSDIDLEIQVPPDFPEKHYESLVRTANLCAVKKHLEHPPRFNVYTKVT
jgi:putative redox protein